MSNDRPLSIPVILGTTRKARMSAHAARFMVGQIEGRNGVTTELNRHFQTSHADR